MTGGKERIKYYLDQFNTTYNRPAAFDPFVAHLHARKTVHYLAMLAQGAIPLRTGVRRLLQEARTKQLRLAIATTTTPSNVTGLLKNTLGEESESWFEIIAAGDIVPAKKPAPDIYTYVLEKLNISPERCVALEDSANGVKSAVGAGITTLVTLNDYTANEDLTGAALVVDQLGEPNQPFTVISGNSHQRHFVDLALLEKLVAH
ncbi:MAG: HAD family hydrolase [Halothiobacillaceae bacterium]|nr:MAG: HAD family hydrolase [Halothiobacillaceae bacterium]